MSRRLIEFDIIKGIAIFCVILGHLGIDSINRVVFTFHMPIFFLISGYFINAKADVQHFIYKNIHQLIIPYIATVCAIILLSIPISLYMNESILQNIWKWFGGGIYGAGFNGNMLIKHFPSFIGALWFLLALFWGKLWVRKVIDFKLDIWKSSFLIILMSYLGWVTATKIWLPWDIQAGATSAVFIWLGYIVKANAILTIRPSKWIVCICLMIMAWCIRYFNGFWMVANYFGNGIMDFIGAFAISYLIYWSVKLCFIHCNNFSKVLSWYGKYSLVILCFHIIELDLFPWAVFMSFIVSMGINKFVMWSIIIICKLVWVTFGVFIVLNVPVLRKIFNA